MEITVRNLSDLRLAEKNVRRHTDKQISEYIRSLEMFGQIKPIIVDETGKIIAGNGLYQALVQMGRETCDCYVISGLTANQKRKLMLADNRVYELGVTDMDVFESIIKELNGDVDVPGWDEDLLEMMTAVTEDIDEIVSDYGNYDEADVSKISERTVYSAPQPVTTAPQPAVTPAQSATSPTQAADASPAQAQRVIVCPKCGERICL